VSNSSTETLFYLPLLILNDDIKPIMNPMAAVAASSKALGSVSVKLISECEIPYHEEV
jgi:hypothetical protein